MTTVNDIEHTESQSLSGIGVVKFFFQPNASEELSYGQITAFAQTRLGFAPPGTTPPYVLAYNASTVPVMQLAMSSDELSEAKIFDLGQNVLRVALATVPGAPCPGRTAACNGKCKSISTPMRCALAASPATMSPMRSRRRISFCPPACRRSATSSTSSRSMRIPSRSRT